MGETATREESQQWKWAPRGNSKERTFSGLTCCGHFRFVAGEWWTLSFFGRLKYRIHEKVSRKKSGLSRTVNADHLLELRSLTKFGGWKKSVWWAKVHGGGNNQKEWRAVIESFRSENSNAKRNGFANKLVDNGKQNVRPLSPGAAVLTTRELPDTADNQGD